MDPIARMVASGAAGVSGSSATYVDDVFSTYLFDGTGSAQTITNGIDLSGEGGLTWIKRRSAADPHQLYDTERGANKLLRSDRTSEQVTNQSDLLTSFNSDGFSLGADSGGFGTNPSSSEMVSWSFRKAPGFFDIVTYTGTGSTQNISHSLGSTPGMIIIKNIDSAYHWTVWHRSLGTNQFLRLNHHSGAGTSSAHIPSVSSTTFTCGGDAEVNGNNKEYVAYVFAHDDQSFGTNSDEAIIKCDSYTGTDSSVDINVGFEVQWVLIKNISNASDQYGNADWTLYDMMRPFNLNSSRKLHPNTSASDTSGGRVFPTATGFGVDNESNIDFNASGDTYAYMAIRRPHKPPTAGTDVFALDATSASGSTGNAFDAPFPVDMEWHQDWGSSVDKYVGTRLIGGKYLRTNSSATELSGSSMTFDSMDGVLTAFNTTDYSAQMFKRAPGFFDVVAYTGNGSARTIPHNLGATPSVVIVKGRDSAYNWYWQHYALGANTLMQLNTDESQGTNGQVFNSTLPTSSVFSIGGLGAVNTNGSKYIAYLFGDLNGISKAGTYSGTGNNINVDCGFSAGARFVIIKRVDGSPGQTGQGDWYMWDTAHGIVSGNDPYILLNSNAAEVTNTDYIDPLNAGFTVTSSAPAALNASGGTYLFLAIA